MASDNGYRNQRGSHGTQSGRSYPGLQTSNPLQDVRDAYRQPQEDAYKMQPGRFMPPISPGAVDMISDGRATVREGGSKSGDQNFDIRSKTFSSLDENMRTKWINQGQMGDVEGRR